MTKTNQIDTSGIYENRVLIFMETSPQNSKYNQILLTNDQFKQITALLGKPTGEVINEIETYQIETSVEEYELPDLQSYEN